MHEDTNGRFDQVTLSDSESIVWTHSNPLWKPYPGLGKQVIAPKLKELLHASQLRVLKLTLNLSVNLIHASDTLYPPTIIKCCSHDAPDDAPDDAPGYL